MEREELLAKSVKEIEEIQFLDTLFFFYKNRGFEIQKLPTPLLVKYSLYKIKNIKRGYCGKERGHKITKKG